MTVAALRRTVAVTGAGGYVGRRLVGDLAADAGVQVVALVRRPIDLPSTVRQVVGDLGERGTVDRVCAEADAVVHLAGPNEVCAAQDPAGSIDAVVRGALGLADAARQHGVRRLVYLSTVHVYGARMVAGAVLSEETPGDARSPYAVARLAAEQLLAAGGPPELVVFRLTNSVGAPGAPDVDRWSLVANDLCRQAATEGVLRLRTSGTQWRDFVPLADVCRIVAAGSGLDVLPPGIYNLGSGEPLTVRALAGLVVDAFARLGVGPPALEAPDPEPTPPGPYRVAVEKLSEAGFRATGSVAAAVDETARWCLEHLKGVHR